MAGPGKIVLEEGERLRVGARAAEYLYQAIQRLSEQPGPIVIAICGGTSPDMMYDPLYRRCFSLAPETRARLLFTLTDDRRVPLDHSDSNWARMYQQFFVPAVGAGLLGGANFLPFPSAMEDPAAACATYNEALEQNGGKFDIVVLAPGEDGHAAGCWPGRESVQTELSGYVFEPHRPKPPEQGYTATLKLLESASYCVALFFGEGKEEAFKRYRTEPQDSRALPIQAAKEIAHRFVGTDLRVPESERQSV